MVLQNWQEGWLCCRQDLGSNSCPRYQHQTAWIRVLQVGELPKLAWVRAADVTARMIWLRLLIFVSC